MEPLMIIATFAGGLVGGWIGSHRKLDRLAQDAANRAIEAHEHTCVLRHTMTPSGSWRLPTVAPTRND